MRSRRSVGLRSPSEVFVGGCVEDGGDGHVVAVGDQLRVECVAPRDEPTAQIAALEAGEDVSEDTMRTRSCDRS